MNQIWSLNFIPTEKANKEAITLMDIISDKAIEGFEDRIEKANSGDEHRRHSIRLLNADTGDLGTYWCEAEDVTDWKNITLTFDGLYSCFTMLMMMIDDDRKILR